MNLEEKFIKEKGYSNFNPILNNEWSNFLLEILQDQSKEIDKLKRKVIKADEYFQSEYDKNKKLKADLKECRLGEEVLFSEIDSLKINRKTELINAFIEGNKNQFRKRRQTSGEWYSKNYENKQL